MARGKRFLKFPFKNTWIFRHLIYSRINFKSFLSLKSLINKKNGSSIKRDKEAHEEGKGKNNTELVDCPLFGIQG